MPYFSFVSGQVRAQESRLISKAQIDRMVGAKDAQAAFDVLVDSAYAEYIDADTTAADFNTIIRQGLYETKELLMKGSENDLGLRFLWLQFDVNNLKRALKARLIEGATSIANFSEHAGYSNLGMLDQAEIEDVVFHNGGHRRIPLALYLVVDKAEELYKQAGDDFVVIEMALDKALAEFFLDLRNDRVRTTFLQKLVRHWIDKINFRNLARSVLIRKESVPREAWLEGGNIAFYAVEKVKTADELAKYASRTKFQEVSNKITDEDPVESIKAVERELDRYYYDFLKWESIGADPSLPVLINYFEQRMKNAQTLKLIMYGKFNNLSAEAIYELLEQI